MDNSKIAKIEQNLDENGNSIPYDIDEMLYDNYDWEYVDEGSRSIDYWEILNELKKEDKVMKCVTVESDERIFCIGIILDRINENNVLDVIMKINEKNVDKTDFLRIIVARSNSDKYEEFFIRDYDHYDDYNNRNSEYFTKMLYEELDKKGLVKYMVALNI